MSTTRYAVDYAKRVAKCKKCGMQLPKGELRVAKIAPNPFVQNADGPPPDMKTYFHAMCIFDTFTRARATTKVPEEPGDFEGWSDLTDEDRNEMLKHMEELSAVREKKGAGGKTPTKTPKKAATEKEDSEKESSSKTPSRKEKEEKTGKGKREKKEDDDEQEEKSSKSTVGSSKSKSEKKEKKKEDGDGTKKVNEDSKGNQFERWCKLCDVIASLPKYTEKSKVVSMYVRKAGFDGDVLTIVRLLIPAIDQRVYNVKEKQLVKHFATIFSLNHDELMDGYKMSGDVSETLSKAVKECGGGLAEGVKSKWSVHKVDRWLSKLTEYTRDEEQLNHLKFAAKRLSPLELKYVLRLVKKDLRINAGEKHILDGLNESAYEAFQNCRDLEMIVDRAMAPADKNGGTPGVKLAMDVGIRLGTPVLPMLAEACKSVEQAMSRCKGGMYSEIKYDGERVQLHKNGAEFRYFSRSLKPVAPHKIQHLADWIPKAFPAGNDLILDAEVLLVDTATGKPLPFGTLGVHKKKAFTDAAVCLFVFDCLLYNNRNMMNEPIRERRRLLEEVMVEVPCHVQLSNYEHIKHGDNSRLKSMIWKAIDEGLEGLVLKDVESVYEPGKRHWLKVKKDYLESGSMADTADLVVLGAYFGTGSKGGQMSVFLMGVRDETTGNWKTVTKCGNGHTDDELAKINKALEGKMKRIDRDYDSVPSWMRCARQLVPDFVIQDPKHAPVWEITGAEFSRSDVHTAGGVSIRFPRVTRVRGDKDWQTATTQQQLAKLFEVSKTKCDFVRDEADDETPLYARKSPRKAGKEEEEEESDKKVEKNAAPKKESPKKERPAKRAREEKKEKEEEEGGQEKEEEQGEPESKRKPVCQYGAGCYRKNPQHKADFWHPEK